MPAEIKQLLPWLIRFAVLGGLYVAVVACAHFLADSQMFFPSMGSGRKPKEMIRIPQPDGTALAALYLPNSAARHTVWFFHGNAEDLGDLEPLLLEFHRRGYAVFAYDYPGYGLSGGRPSELSIYAATNTGARYLRDTLKVPLDNVILYGRSIGAGPAVELALHEPVAGLVLQSAFMSAYRVMTRWRLLPFDKFENLRRLPEVHCPVLVMHGGEDRIVPPAHGEALLAAAAGPKRHLWIEAAGHNDFLAIAGERYWQALREFEQGLP